jgi:hypothetical protein
VSNEPNDTTQFVTCPAAVRASNKVESALITAANFKTDGTDVTSITDALLNDAFELAYFILGDRAASIYVLIAAVDKIKAASVTQDRRQTYTPTGRSSFPATRTKVNLSEIQLLQRLIYIESELFERLLEEQQVSREDLVIRYIKHLVRITTRHNSFYVALGLCRLLYNYTTAETSEIYSTVLQDPARMRDYHYYRSRKKRLLNDMKERFGELIQIQKGFRGEERFQTEPSSQQFVELVKQCLMRFTPWQSTCVLPRDLDPKRNLVPTLLFEGTDPDKEHEIELNRFHTLTHPACLERLTTALGLDLPERRLGVPHFFVSREEPPAANRFSPTRLSAGELKAIRNHLDKNSTHRRTSTGAALVCLIDQKRIAILEPWDTPSVSFHINEDAELLEIRSCEADEEFPVALWPIDRASDLSARVSATAVLTNGDKLTFRIDPPLHDSDGPGEASMTISFAGAPVRDSIVTRLRRFTQSLGQPSGEKRSLHFKPALVILILGMFGVGLWTLFQSRRAPSPIPTPPQASGLSRPTPTPSNIAPTPSDDTSHIAQVSPLPAEKPNAVRPAERSKGESLEATRGRQLRPRSLALASIKRVYVDALGDDAFSRELRENLIRELAATQLAVTANRQEADAVLNGSVRQSSSQNQSIVSLELINVAGEVIWSFEGKRFATAKHASLEALKDLRNALHESERKR